MYDISESGMTKKVEYRGQRGFARFGMASHVSAMSTKERVFMLKHTHLLSAMYTCCQNGIAINDIGDL